MGLADGEGVEGEGGDDEGEREWESVRQWVGCRRRIEEPKDGLARPGSGSVRAVQRSAEELGLRGRAHWVGWLVRRGASKQEATFAAGRGRGRWGCVRRACLRRQTSTAARAHRPAATR